jgi:dTDP-4-amino-4,6-dideoxygalactose transaminase
MGQMKGDFPVSEDVADRCLSLPMSPCLSEEDQKQVIDAFANTLTL